MKAFQLVAQGSQPKYELREILDPSPSGHEALVQVRACGLNHLDLWLEQGHLPMKTQLPRTPGAEAAGVVSQIGAAVTGWQIGDRVAVQSNLFCGKCEFCERGEESMCLRGELVGVDRDGGFAQQILVPASALVKLPDSVSFQIAAGLTLAGSTAMHMLMNRAQVKDGAWVLAIAGASGVGSAAIQIAKGLGARVISTASTEPKRGLARQLGAEFAVDSTDPQWPSEVRRITGKRGVDLVIEHVGGDVLLKCFECLARGGTIVTCGATAGRDVALHLWPLFVKQQRLVGSYGRNRVDLVATLEWAAAGRLSPPIHGVFPLERAGEAFAALRAREVLGKVIVTP